MICIIMFSESRHFLLDIYALCRQENARVQRKNEEISKKLAIEQQRSEKVFCNN